MESNNTSTSNNHGGSNGSSATEQAEQLKFKGNSLFLMGKYVEAIDFYSQALSLSPANTVYWTNRATCFYKIGEAKGDKYDLKGYLDFENTINDSNKALSLDNRCIKAYLRKAQALYMQLRMDLAKKVYLEGLIVDPKEKQFHEGLALCKDQRYSSGGLFIRATTANPDCPIRSDFVYNTTSQMTDVEFIMEKTDLREADGDLRKDEINTAKQMESHTTVGEWWVDLNIRKAYMSVSKAYQLPLDDYKGRNEIARNALTISPYCPESYVIFAETASTMEEALEFFKKGFEVSSFVTPYNKQIEYKQNIFLVTNLRAQFRSLLGIANTLRKLGKYEESLIYFKQLIEKDIKGLEHTNFSPYPNFRLCLVDVYLSLKKYPECRRFMKDHLEFFKLSSSSPTLLFTRILLDYIADKDIKERDLKDAFENFPHVLPYLLGAKKLPNVQDGITLSKQNSITSAVAYLRYNLKHWKSTVGLIDCLKEKFVRFYQDFILSYCCVYNAGEIIRFIDRIEVICPVGTSGGVFPAKTPLHLAAQNDIQSLVPVLLHRGFTPNMRVLGKFGGLTPLHHAAYYGRFEILKMLLDKNGNTRLEDEQGLSPFHMACNQGNYMCVEEMLKRDPTLVNYSCTTAPSPIGCVFSVINLCLTKVTKCTRCSNNDPIPHHAQCSPTKTISTLLNYGADLSHRRSGSNLLHLACRDNMDEALLMLIQKMKKNLKIYINEEDDEGHTPLDVALHMKYAKTAKILLDHGGKTSFPKLLEKMMKEISVSESEPPLPLHVPRCNFCKKTGVPLLLCAKCKNVRYCDVNCQRGDFASHKAHCRPITTGKVIQM